MVQVHSMNAVYILFAYVVAVYLAGSALDRFQAYALTALYSLFFMFPVSSGYTSWHEALTIARMFFVEHPDIAQQYFQSPRLPLTPELMAAVFLSAWLLSIIFMIRVRKSANYEDEGT